MHWYKDRQLQAEASIFRSLFPEQTKTIPRIIAWSTIFLLDLILGIPAAVYFGMFDFGNKLTIGLLLAVIFGIFWLQGRIWYGIVGSFRKGKQIG